ncbi:Protein of unknown function [Arthrobacter sp. 49Tsu3.1M3]|jgi:putative membrane protein|uniref:DUF1304 family protein n=1 Tax=Arthrobacter sp. 49Tsu3.1M3 TaxID=1279029 RepID=UPI0009CF9752|nr:DUF1304 family protein [Arthrobacter sp. 49Tsu3.1M3]SKB82565.1 Protein of unknown function [Arthrobacter sp. 49Tsu3.1M3]
MTGLIQVLGVVFGVLLTTVGIVESFLMRSQRRERLFLIDSEAERARLWTFNLGFYNVIWGIGAVAGALMLAGPDAMAGQAVLLITCVGHMGLSLVMFFSERRLWRLAVAEGFLPLTITILLLT